MATSRRGFLLVELIFSLMLLSVISVYIAGWYGQLLIFQKYNTDRIKAINLCSFYLEKILAGQEVKNHKEGMFDISVTRRPMSDNVQDFKVVVEFVSEKRKNSVWLASIGRL